MRKSSYYAALLLVGVMLTTCSSPPTTIPGESGAQAQFRLEDPIPTDSDLTVGTLENGLRYYIRVNEKPKKRAWLQLIVNAGSVLEGDDQQGLAHFVEHMGFNGTEHFPGNELVDYLETVGVSFGFDANASTGFDETVYRLTVPTDSTEVVERAFQILEDWAHLVSFDPEEIEKERGVIVEEWRRHLGAGERMLNKQLPIVFKDSRYAKRLPIGKKEIIETFDHETLRRFYNDWYRPDLMAVVAVGDFDQEWIQGLIEKHFASIAQPPNPKARTLFPVPDHKETLFAIATDPEATGTSVGLYFKRDVSSKITVDDYRQKLIGRIYNVMLTYRLIELTHKPDPPFLFARSSKGRFVKTKDVYVLGASVDEEGIERGLDALLTETQRIKRYGFQQTEFERAKNRLLRTSEKFYDERGKLTSMFYAGKCRLNFTRGVPVTSYANEFELCRELLPGIRLDEVNSLRDEFMNDENLVVFVRAPEKEGLEIPSEGDLLAIFKSVQEKDIEDYVDVTSDEPLIAELPEPGEIVKERTIEELGVTEWTLSNGARVLLMPTDFYNDRITFTAFSPGGTSIVPDDQYYSASAASGIVSGSGAGVFSRDELRKKLTDKIATLHTGISPLTECVGGGGSTKDLQTIFELIYLQMTSPRKSDDAFQSQITRYKSMIENMGASPEMAFMDTVEATVAQYHPRALSWDEEAIDKIDLDTAFDIYKDRFADASDFVFIFAGNMELGRMRPLVETYIGGLPSIHRKETWKDTGIRPPRGVVKKTVERGMEPKSSVALVFTGDFEWSRENATALEAMTRVMGIRLREVLREDLGGTYHASCWADCDKYPVQDYRIDIRFGCDPERVDELIGVVFEQIDSLKTHGPDEKSVTKFRETQKRRYERSLESNHYWVRQLRESYFYEEDPMSVLDRPNLAQSVSAESIQEAARKCFDTDNYVQVVLVPEPQE
jgi:zinc protease